MFARWRVDKGEARLGGVTCSLADFHAYSIRRRHTIHIVTYLAEKFWPFRENLTVEMQMGKVQRVMHHCIKLITEILQHMYAGPDMRSSLLH